MDLVHWCKGLRVNRNYTIKYYIATWCNVLVGLQRRWSTSSGFCLILAERESRICTSMYSVDFLLILSGTITWNMNDGKPTTWMKFINPHKKSRQNLRQQICRKAILSDPDQNQEWLGALVQSDDETKIHSESQTFHRPSVDRPCPLNLTSYCQWSYSSLWSQNIWWIQHPLTTKHLRVEWNMSHITRAKHFIASFADIWCLLS